MSGHTDRCVLFHHLSGVRTDCLLASGAGACLRFQDQRPSIPSSDARRIVEGTGCTCRLCGLTTLSFPLGGSQSGEAGEGHGCSIATARVRCTPNGRSNGGLCVSSYMPPFTALTTMTHTGLSFDLCLEGFRFPVCAKPPRPGRVLRTDQVSSSWGCTVLASSNARQMRIHPHERHSSGSCTDQPRRQPS